MAHVITVNSDAIAHLDLSPAQTVIEVLVAELQSTQDPQLQFTINYPQDPDDPRELSEIAEVRLWFVRLDVDYPWLPFWLDWQNGELGRYAAMLVPHQFSAREGIQYNPEALEIFLMNKIFVLSNWLKLNNLPGRAKLKAMAQVLGYELDDGLFDLLQV
jgi:hypothetical protein